MNLFFFTFIEISTKFLIEFYFHFTTYDIFMTKITSKQRSLITLTTLAARLDPDFHGQTLADATSRMGAVPLLNGISEKSLGGIIEK